MEINRVSHITDINKQLSRQFLNKLYSYDEEQQF